MIRINAEVEGGMGLASPSFRGPLIEIWIGVFISIIAFYLGCPFRVVVLPFANPLPEIRDEVPKKLF